MRALLQSTGARFTILRCGPQTALFHQGDPADSVLYIEKGRVKLAVTARNGREAICGLLEAGAFVGEEVLSGQGARRESAIAMIATEALAVPKVQMQALLRAEPAVQDRLMKYIMTRNARLQASLADQLLNLSEERLAHTLFMLAGCDPPRTCKCVLPHVSQETIAEMVGTTRSRVNVFMRKFKKLGLIEDEGGTLFITPSRLHEMDEEPAPADLCGSEHRPSGAARTVRLRSTIT